MKSLLVKVVQEKTGHDIPSSNTQVTNFDIHDLSNANNFANNPQGISFDLRVQSGTSIYMVRNMQLDLNNGSLALPEDTNLDNIYTALQNKQPSEEERKLRSIQNNRPSTTTIQAPSTAVPRFSNNLHQRRMEFLNTR